MARAISYKAPTGKTFKSVVKDLETGLYCNDTTSAWQAANSSACQVALTEDSTYKGVYAGTGKDTPVKGGLYQIIITDDNDADFDSSDAQATTRANAAAIQSAIEAALLGDPNLSIQNGGTAAVIWILVADTNVLQTPPDEMGMMGRFTQIAMKCHVYNVLHAP